VGNAGVLPCPQPGEWWPTSRNRSLRWTALGLVSRCDPSCDRCPQD
jgi:hypothetical protein